MGLGSKLLHVHRDLATPSRRKGSAPQTADVSWTCHWGRPTFDSGPAKNARSFGPSFPAEAPGGALPVIPAGKGGNPVSCNNGAAGSPAFAGDDAAVSIVLRGGSRPMGSRTPAFPPWTDSQTGLLSVAPKGSVIGLGPWNLAVISSGGPRIDHSGKPALGFHLKSLLLLAGPTIFLIGSGRSFLVGPRLGGECYFGPCRPGKCQRHGQAQVTALPRRSLQR